MSLATRIAERGFDSDDESNDGKAQGTGTSTNPLSAFTAALLQVLVYLKLNVTDIKARTGTYILGIVSCTIVVLIVALMVTVIGRLPILFMRLAEIDQGEADLILSPGGQASDATALNYSRVLRSTVFSTGTSSFHTPRMVLDPVAAGITLWPLGACTDASGAPVSTSAGPGGVAFMWQPNPSYSAPQSGNVKTSTDSNACPAKLGCPNQYCNQKRSLSARVFGIDFAREAAIGLGRSWSAPSPGPGACIIHQDLAGRLGVKQGDVVLLQADIAYSMLQAFIDSELDDWLSAPYSTWGRVIIPLRIATVVSKGGGKFADSMSDFLLLDYPSMLQTLGPYLNPTIGTRKRKLFVNADPFANANQIIFEMPPDQRIAVYSQSDNKDVLASVTAFASPIIAILGFNQVSVLTPISDYIQANSFFSLFLGLILSLMILGLSFLCIVLIHSLLSVGVETRTFELGIMRMIGMTRVMLTGYVVMGALMFAIPAWGFGLSLAQILLLVITNQLQSSLGVSISPLLTGDAIGYATLAGMGMPLLSSIAPILVVLAMDLPTALDSSRGRNNAIVYDIERNGEARVNWTLVGLGIFMAVAGFLVYYLFPLALLTFNITLLFYIFFGILMGMLFGLVLLATSFQGIVETIVSYVFLFWESPAVFVLIGKNLIAHRVHNRKTALMFAMSIGFLIFLSVTFDIQIQSVIYGAQRSYGGQLRVRYSGTGDLSFATMEVVDAALRRIRDSPQNISGGAVKGLKWTWVTASATAFPYIDNATVRTVGRYVTLTPTVQAIAPNFWSVVDSRYFIPKNIRPSSWAMGESLYSVEGSSRVVLSTAYQTKLALTSLDDAFAVDLVMQTGNETTTYLRLASCDAWLDSSSVVTFSKYTPNRNSVILSMPALMQRSQFLVPSVESAVFSRMIIAMSSDGDVSRVRSVLLQALTDNGLNSITAVDNLLSVQDSLTVAVNAISLFFVFAQVMATCVCYFALSTSMSTNVHSQSKEIGILRSVGLRKFPLTRVYVWEAFVLVFAASLLGICVGVLMGYTIVLQRALFTQLPLPFVFPWQQLLALLALSFFFALLSSLAPIRSLLNTRSITTILRRSF